MSWTVQYQPITVEAARDVAQRFHKDIVLIVGVDDLFGLYHVTTYGRTAEHKDRAAELGEIAAQFLALDRSQQRTFQDYRAVPEAESAQRIDELSMEIGRLRGAIREHHDQRGDDRCWLDDQKLYAAAGLEPADLALPARGDFLASCERYWCQRQPPECRTRPPGKTIGQLEREVSQLRSERDELIWMCITPCSAGFEVSPGFALDDVAIVATLAEAVATVERAAGIAESSRDEAVAVSTVRSLFRAAMFALRSYQYGNRSSDLAEEVADMIKAALHSLSGELTDG